MALFMSGRRPDPEHIRTEQERLLGRVGVQRETARSDQARLTSVPAGLSQAPVGKSQSPLLAKGKNMGIIAFIILGALAGVIAKAIMPGNDPGGFIVTTIIGIVGALLGGFLAAALFDAHPLDEFFDISTWVTAIVGSIILLAIYRVIVNRNDGRALRA